MLKREVTINQLQLGLFSKIVPDIPDDVLYVPAAGHGHLPVWVMGHLAICAELGQQMLGGAIQHPEWMPMFGPGSPGTVEPNDALTKQALAKAISEGYAALQKMALDASESVLEQPHGVALFDDSPLVNVADFIALLLTNHFGFHLAQLSSCRREAGFPALF